MAPSTVLLLGISTFLLAGLSRANDCTKAGYSCVPEENCPKEYRQDIPGCETVCCNLKDVNTCVARGGTCIPAGEKCNGKIEPSLPWLSRANDCTKAGYSCVPEENCPKEYRQDIPGCETVCCNLKDVNTCVGRGGTCIPAGEKCNGKIEPSLTCDRGQQCCIHV
ncbi:carboxypeptidase inhibitor [Ixodes scapularis]